MATDPFADFYRGAMAAESSGRPDAVNATTGASGLFQFTPDTWRGVVRNYGERYGLRPDGVFDVAQQNAAIRAITENEYAPELRRAGMAITPGNLYLVHLFGAPTFRRLASDPTASADRALQGNRVSWMSVWEGNQGVFGRDPAMTAGQAFERAIAYYNRKANGSPRKAGSPRTPVAPKPPVAPPAPPTQVSTQPPLVQESTWMTRTLRFLRTLISPRSS